MNELRIGYLLKLVGYLQTSIGLHTKHAFTGLQISNLVRSKTSNFKFAQKETHLPLPFIYYKLKPYLSSPSFDTKHSD